MSFFPSVNIYQFLQKISKYLSVFLDDLLASSIFLSLELWKAQSDFPPHQHSSFVQVLL